MPILLGKDCTISGGGLDNACVRDVAFTLQAKEVEWQPLGGKDAFVWNAGFQFTIEVELLANGGESFSSELQSGDTVTISGSGYSGTMVITAVSRAEPLDGAVTYRVQFKRSK